MERYAAFFAERPDIACICSGYSDCATQAFWERFQFLDTLYNQQFTPEHPRWASSCNFGCRRDAFWSAGGFPEIYLNEDMEFFFFLSEKHDVLSLRDAAIRVGKERSRNGSQAPGNILLTGNHCGWEH
jgi:hypothetical protein